MNTQYTIDDILAILPHRAPFLFVDRVIKLTPGRSIVTERDLHATEPHFAGHFPGHPIMPGVLVTDALAQTSGLLWGLSKKANSEDTEAPPVLFYLAAVSMKYTTPATPGDTLRMTSATERVFGKLHTFMVEAAVGKCLIARGSLTLAMKEGAL